MKLSLTKTETDFLKLVVGALAAVDDMSDNFIGAACYTEPLDGRLMDGNPYEALFSLERKLTRVK